MSVVYQIPYENVLEAVNQLPPRERFVIEERSDGRTLREIGEVMGVCIQRVRSIQCKAQRRIHKYFQNPAHWN